jgi:hypothetical protein
MQKLQFGYLLLLAVCLTACGAAPQQKSVANAGRELDSQAKASLGVSVRALSFLYQAEPGSFLVAGGLNANNGWPALQELETAGYAKINRFPSGSGEMVQIQLTPKGQELLGVLHGP